MHHLLHQVHDALKRALFVSRPLVLLLKQLTDLSHDFGLLLVALVVLRTQAGLVGLQPLWVLRRTATFTTNTERDTLKGAEIKTEAHLGRDLFKRRIKHFLGEKILHDGLHDGQDVSIVTTPFAALIQSQAFQSLDQVVSSES